MPLVSQYADITATTANRLSGPLPAADGELFNAFFGVDAATSANLASAGSAWSAIGTGPVYTASYASMVPDTQAVRTAITNTATGYTAMGVFRYVTGVGLGSAARIIVTSASSAFAWTITDDGLMSMGGASGSTAATLSIAGDLSQFRFIVANSGGGVDNMIYNLTDDTVSSDGTDGITPTNGLSNFDLTGGAPVSNTRQVDWAWCRIRPGIADETERDAYYAWVKGILLNFRGVSC
jgi:hypothetical protein